MKSQFTKTRTSIIDVDVTLTPTADSDSMSRGQMSRLSFQGHQNYFNSLMFFPDVRKVKIGNDQEMTRSERNSHSKKICGLN